MLKPILSFAAFAAALLGAAPAGAQAPAPTTFSAEPWLQDLAAMREAFATQVPKRVALEFRERDRVSWDHRKLGGTY